MGLIGHGAQENTIARVFCQHADMSLSTAAASSNTGIPEQKVSDVMKACFDKKFPPLLLRQKDKIKRIAIQQKIEKTKGVRNGL